MWLEWTDGRISFIRSSTTRSGPGASHRASGRGDRPRMSRAPRSSQTEKDKQKKTNSSAQPRARVVNDTRWLTRTPQRGVASPPSATLTPWLLGRAGHHPITSNRNWRRRGRQLGHNPAPRSAPTRQGIKSSIPPARNLRASTRRRHNPWSVPAPSGSWRKLPHSSAADAANRSRQNEFPKQNSQNRNRRRHRPKLGP